VGSWTWREGYESGALKRLMGRHAVREDEGRQGVRVSDESNSLASGSASPDLAWPVDP